MKKTKFINAIILFLFLFKVMPSKALTQTEMMKNYCAVPPYMEVAVKPNIILVMDYSGSMQFPAYISCPTFSTTNRVYVCTDNNNYINASYDKTKIYYGYFESGSYYQYNYTGGYWEKNTSCNPTDDNSGIGTGDNCISGNLLNWLVMSRFDVAVKSLTGGKIKDCGSNKCLIPKGAKRYVIDNNLNCKFTIEPNQDWNSTSTFNDSNYDLTIKVENYNNNTCKIGNFSDRWIRIKVEDSTTIQGILQKNADIANYAFMVFSSQDPNDTTKGRKGVIRFGLNEYRNYSNQTDAMNALVDKIRNELPWGGTPTGESLYEVMDYLKQSNEHNYESNSNYINKGTNVDPYYNPKELKLSPCIKNHIILISDGEWNGSVDPDGVALSLHTQDLRTDLDGTQIANIYTIYTFGDSQAGKNSMQTIAAAGGFIDLDNDSKPFDVDTSKDSKTITFPTSNCNPSSTYKDYCKEWDFDKDGIPNNYFKADSGEEFEKSLSDALNAIIKYNYAGGALSVMAEKSKENGSLSLAYKGTILAQSFFYSQKDGIDWIGKIYGYWYQYDTNTIREDTKDTNGNTNKILDLDIDKIIELKLEGEKTLVIDRYNVDILNNYSKGSLDASFYDPDKINYLFETGKNLSDRQHSDRMIYFAKCNSGNSCMDSFDYSLLDNIGILNKFKITIGDFTIPLLGIPSNCFNMCSYYNNMDSFDLKTAWNKIWNCVSDNNDYQNIIDYIKGKDISGLRNRTINGKVWKLGDIISSTPQIVHYEDKNKSYMFVGANDGMLHVFDIGNITTDGLTKDTQIIKLDGNNIGNEVWSFIPLNLLPYLRFLSDPNYCHIYYVDLSPRIYKTKDNKMILIGGLRLGAATGNPNKLNNAGSNTGNNPVNPPEWSCPIKAFDFLKEQCNTCKSSLNKKNWNCNNLSSSSLGGYDICIGLSSYFALDITDPENPKFLWEFSHPNLGFSYSGATLIYKGSNTYVMFGSGPTSYDGNSLQELKYFVIPLYNPDLKNPIILSTNIGTKNNGAFSGRLPEEAYDADNDGDSDYIFVGYGKNDGNMDNWKGGVLKIDVRNSDPNNWKIDKYFNDAFDPVTAKVIIGQCFNKPYMFFGTGRWFYKLDNPLSGQKNRIYGLPLKCDATTCSPNQNATHSSADVCTDAGNNVERSWYIELNTNDTGYLKERVVSDPVITDQNIVLFVSTEPKNDSCSFGGRTRMWVLNCATGAAIGDNCSNGKFYINPAEVKGVALLQLSGGDIQQISISQINQTTSWFTGTAPESAPPFIGNVKTQRKTGELILWIEK